MTDERVYAKVGTRVQVLPETRSDDRQHVLDETCWCNPEIVQTSSVPDQLLHHTGPGNPQPGSFCDMCGHFAAYHGPAGCEGVGAGCLYGCDASPFMWGGRAWPRPWLPAPRGLIAEDADA